MNQEREQIARIIHPWPFSDEVVNASRTSIDFHTGAEYRIAALAKADAILALRSGGDNEMHWPDAGHPGLRLNPEGPDDTDPPPSTHGEGA